MFHLVLHAGVGEEGVPELLSALAKVIGVEATSLEVSEPFRADGSSKVCITSAEGTLIHTQPEPERPDSFNHYHITKGLICCLAADPGTARAHLELLLTALCGPCALLCTFCGTDSCVGSS